MRPREALLHVRTLLTTAGEMENIQAIRRLHREVLKIVEAGLSDKGAVLPFRPISPDKSGPKAT